MLHPILFPVEGLKEGTNNGRQDDTILSSVKGACDLMMHGTIESSTPQVHSAFDAGLQKCLCMQNEIYSKMSQKGWYPSTQVEQNKIDQARQKFSANG